MNKQGIGLGLSICKKLIGLLGPKNELFISSELGKGSKFGFLLFSKCKELKQPSYKDSIKKIFTHQIADQTGNENLKLIAASNNDQKIYSLKNIENLDDVEQVFSDFIPSEQSLDEGMHDICTDMKQKMHLNNNLFNSKINNMNEQIEQKEGKRQIKILIADDNPFNILVLESYLKKISEFQFIVLTASNGQEALDAYQSNNQTKSKDNIDIIVMDCDMPIMDGFQSAKSIKQLVKTNNFVEIEIVGYTCYEGDKEKCKQFGMNRFLAKPATEQIFAEFIANIFKINK